MPTPQAFPLSKANANGVNQFQPRVVPTLGSTNTRRHATLKAFANASLANVFNVALRFKMT
jgi:hypothetical protein